MKKYEVQMQRIGRTKPEAPKPIFVEVPDGTTKDRTLDILADTLYPLFRPFIRSMDWDVTVWFNPGSNTTGVVSIEDDRFGTGTFKEV